MNNFLKTINIRLLRLEKVDNILLVNMDKKLF